MPTLLTDANDFQTIEILTDQSITPQIVKTDDKSLGITTTIFAEGLEIFESAKEQARIEHNGANLKISVGNYLREGTLVNGCVKQITNGKLTTVYGICIETIRIQLPKDSQTVVIVDGKKISL